MNMVLTMANAFKVDFEKLEIAIVDYEFDEILEKLVRQLEWEDYLELQGKLRRE